MKQLRKSLAAAGLDTIALDESVLVSPFGGRVMGLCPNKIDNVLWTDPKIGTDSYLASDQWVNLGGDRTWISPEVDTHISDPSHFEETYEVPKAVDPGAYEVTDRNERSVTLMTLMTLHFIRANADVRLKLTKKITSIDTPPISIEGRLSFAGYRMEASLAAESELPTGVHPALWHLLQVPQGGTLMVPVKEGVTPRTFFGDHEIAVEDGVLKCHARANRRFKLALRARHCTGRMLYHRANAGQSTLTIRHFPVHDEASYYDVPYDDLADTGYVVELYVDDLGIGDFAELEYHSPALRGESGKNAVNDTNEVWAFSGATDVIEQLRQSLLQEG